MKETGKVEEMIITQVDQENIEVDPTHQVVVQFHKIQDKVVIKVEITMDKAAVIMITKEDHIEIPITEVEITEDDLCD